MPKSPVPEGRRSTRITTKKRSSLIVNVKGHVERFPCLIVDKSQDGLRLRGSFHLRRGQVVKVTSDDDLLALRCRVIWFREGEAGLEVF